MSDLGIAHLAKQKSDPWREFAATEQSLVAKLQRS